MKAVFNKEAQSEFNEAQAYYALIDAELKEAFAESVRQGLRLVLAQPASGRIEFEDVRRVVLKRFPYKLLYIIEADHLLVVAVAHQRRQPEYWFNRIANK
ncbi:MAG: type II toxin-antitoxin system RelE/ParE family toxin [Polaromonas sp.]